jgi:hypothetical protein
MKKLVYMKNEIEKELDRKRGQRYIVISTRIKYKCRTTISKQTQQRTQSIAVGIEHEDPNGNR